MAALGAGAGVGVVPATVGAVQTVGQGFHQVLELRPRHLVELRDPGDHPALRSAEHQRAVAALPLVKALNVVVGLVASHPVPGLGGRHVGGHGLGLSQQSHIAVDRLGRSLGGRPRQRRRMLAGQPTRRQRLPYVGHLLEDLGPPGPMLGLAGRAARLPAQRLGRTRLARAELAHLDRHPGLKAVENGPCEADPPGEFAEAVPVHSGYIDGLHVADEFVPHGNRPECSVPDRSAPG